MKISRHILLMVLALFWTGQSFGENPFKPTQEFIRSLSRQFDTDAKGTTALYNKYGQIKVNTWSNNKVKIDVQIVVNARNQKEADKMFERINVNFTNAWGYVKAETFISETMYGGWWFNENSNCQDFKINYDIWMPENNQLDLKNKYGNSWVSKLNGKLLAEIKYGDLHAEIITNDADLNIAYGKADIQQTSNVTGQLSYSELAIGDAKDIELDTKYSEFKVDRAGDIRLTSRYDDFVFGRVGDMRIQTKYANVKSTSAKSAWITAQYSDFRFNSLAGTLDVDLNYGNLVLDNLGRNFASVNIVGKYTTAKVSVERGASYRFDAEAYNADIHYPGGANVKNRSDSGTHEMVAGSVGGDNARALIKAKMHYGDFELK